MNIQFLWRADINAPKWDAAIQQAHNTRIYALSWYLDIVCRQQWGALILGDYHAVMPLPYNRKWFGIAQAYQPMFCQQLGVFSEQLLSQHTIQTFYNAIPKFFRRVRLQGNSHYATTGKLTTTLQPNYILSTNAPYNQLYAQYNSNTKRNIKKATQQLQTNLTLTSEITGSQLIQLFGQARPELQYTHHHQQLFIHLTDEVLRRNAGSLYALRSRTDNALYAGALFLQGHTRWYYLLGASNQLGKTCGAAHYLLDTVVQQMANKNLILDFEGSKTHSFAQFYAGFGATPEYYPLVQFWQLPLLSS